MVYNKKKVDDYYKMMTDYNNDYILDMFCNTIPKDKKILELGFGTGKDYLYLKTLYDITPSDYSLDFIEAFNQSHSDLVLNVDAVTMNINNNYDCIYSSKVLNSLTEEDIIISLQKQYEVLNEDGYIFHTFWYGDRSEESSYIDKDTLIKILHLDFEYVQFSYYKEDDFTDKEYDSVVLIARK